MNTRYLPISTAITMGLFLVLSISLSDVRAAEPVRLIFDTDIGNDVDDALAMGVIHALESRGECRLLAVTITKDQDLSAPFIDVINTFYGRGHIPIGVVRNGPTPEASKFTVLSTQKVNGQFRYPHDLTSGADAPEATQMLREILAGQPDQSVVIVQVGFSTNMARLLDSEPCEHSALTGLELVKQKVTLLSIMAGSFQKINDKRHLEYNVIKDIPSAKALVNDWPTPIIFSGYEIGIAIPYPARSIELDYRYVPHHPLAEAYQLYKPSPHNRPTWDLTSVLQAVRPDRQYFDLSSPGRILVEKDGGTRFVETPGGPHQYLIVSREQALRVGEVLVHLASQPPTGQ